MFETVGTGFWPSRRTATAFAAVLVLLLAPALSPASEGELPPGDNLEARRIPPVPLELVDAARPYTEIRSARFVSWHPLRREMLISTRFGDAAQIHLVATPGGARRQLTFFAEPVTRAELDPLDGDSFLFLKDSGGDEFHQLYHHDLDTGRSTLLSDGRKRNALGAWSNDGGLYAHSRVDAGADGAFTKVLLVRPQDFEGGRELATLEGGGWSVVAFTPDDAALLLSRYSSISQSSLFLLDVDGGVPRRLTPAPPAGKKTAWRGGAFGPDGETLFLTSDQNGEFRELYALDLIRGEQRSLTSDIPWDVTSFELTEDGQRLAFLVNEAGVSRLYLLDVPSGRRQRVDAVPVGVVSGLAWHANGGELAFTLSSASSSGDVWSLDAGRLGLTRWTNSETGGLDTSVFSAPELVRWQGRDGLELSGFLYRPPARFRGPRPVIVNIHGGPEGQSRPTFKGKWNYYQQELGVAVLYPNVRGSSGFGKTFVERDNGFDRQDSYEDIDALFDWIEQDPSLDASRILVTGGSYGGHMTFAVATRYGDRICCSIAVVGISNLRTFLENTQGYRRDLRRVEYGDERDPDMYSFLESIAPLHHVEKIRKPIFLVHGRNDPRVPVSESDQIVDLVHGQGVPAWYLVAEDEGHGFRKRKNSDFQFYSEILFVQRFLLGDEGAVASGK